MNKYLITFIISLLFICPLWSGTIYVDYDAGGDNDGTSWDNAYTSLQSALTAASSGDEIWVAKGSYKPTTGTDRTSSFQMKNGVSIYGGFFGNENPATFDLADRDFVTNETILSGDLIGNDDFVVGSGGYQGTTGDDNCYQIIYNPDQDPDINSTAILDGFTITGGNADLWPHDNGGGMFNSSSSPTVTNCTFKSNEVSNVGGGMYNAISSSPTLTNCTFTSNYAYNFGGGMCNDDSSSPTLTNCTFASNSGGGMYNAISSSPTLTNCTFTSNSITEYGYGGGMFNYSSFPTVTNCTFTSNSAYEGGGMFNSSSSPTVTNCTFKSNEASNIGGGMCNDSNCSPIVTNCTFTLNSASDKGGGLYNYSSSPTLNNCIVWGNEATTDGDEIYNYSGTTTLNYSCYGNATGGIYGTLAVSNCITSNPCFVGVGNNPTHPYSIGGNSPCCDAGNDNYFDTGAFGDYDIRGAGFPRKLDKITGGVGVIDMGAYEYKVGVDPISSAVVLYVNINASGSNSGTTWVNAYTSLQSTLTAAVSNNEIWVAKGTYKPSYDYGLGGGSRYYHFRMINGVSIYGGFAGTENAVSERTNYGVREANETILSGDLNGNDGSNWSNRSDNCYHVIYNPDQDPDINSTAIIDGFTITGGYADGSTPHYFGAGMCNQYSSPTVANCVFSWNWADSYGGGMCNTNSSSPPVTNCIFISNSVGWDGGAMYNNYSSSPTVTNCTFCANSASDQGGGMYNDSSPTLNNCIVWGNEATTDGDEIYINSGTTTLNYSCYANAPGDIYGTPAVSNCITSDPCIVGVWNPHHPYSIYGISPCCDTGNNTYCSEIYDIRGEDFPRKLNKTNGETGRIDMGAYEYNVNPTLPVTLSTFTAQFIENTPTLYWETQSETDNMGWFVYRNSQENFTTSEKISGFLEGHGTTTQQQSYIYEDTIENPEIGDTYYYWLESIDYSGTVNHYDKVAILTIPHNSNSGNSLVPVPERFGLLQNKPNPVIHFTRIAFNLTESAMVDLNVYNIKGQLVRNLYSGVTSKHTVMWYGKDEQGRELENGVYFYNLLINGKSDEVMKLILMR